MNRSSISYILIVTNIENIVPRLTGWIPSTGQFDLAESEGSL